MRELECVADALKDESLKSGEQFHVGSGIYAVDSRPCGTRVVCLNYCPYEDDTCEYYDELHCTYPEETDRDCPLR